MNIHKVCPLCVSDPNVISKYLIERYFNDELITRFVDGLSNLPRSHAEYWMALAIRLMIRMILKPNIYRIRADIMDLDSIYIQHSQA